MSLISSIRYAWNLPLACTHDVQVSVNKEVSFTDKTLFSERFKSIAEEPEIIVTHASRSKRNKVHFLIVIV